MKTFVSEDRTVLVVALTEEGDLLSVATRETPDHIWGPPVVVRPETQWRVDAS